MAMSADLPFTRDCANLIARAEQVATPCRVFRVEAHGSYHFCADCQKSEASHIIRALLDERVQADVMPLIQVGDVVEVDGCDIARAETVIEAMLLNDNSELVVAIYRDPLWRRPSSSKAKA